MIFAGVFEQAPGLKLILSHSGGVLPSIARRIAMLSAMQAMKPTPRPGADVMRIFAELYYDLAMSANQPTFDYLRTLTPLSQILFGTDYPFQKPDSVASNTAGFRALKGLSPQEHEVVARGNAKRLFPGLQDVR
jgi:6-methylsalicylate decarboxylase